MNQRTLAAGVALTVAAVGAGLYATSKPDPTITTTVQEADAGVTVVKKPRRTGPFDAGPDPIVERYTGPSVRGRDGGVFRTVTTTIVDRSDPENRETLEGVEPAQPECLRRPKGVANVDCRFLKPLPDGGTVALDVPTTFRFNADAGLGSKCKPAACFILAGEDLND